MPAVQPMDLSWAAPYVGQCNPMIATWTISRFCGWNLPNVGCSPPTWGSSCFSRNCQLYIILQLSHCNHLLVFWQKVKSITNYHPGCSCPYRRRGQLNERESWRFQRTFMSWKAKVHSQSATDEGCASRIQGD